MDRIVEGVDQGATVKMILSSINSVVEQTNSYFAIDAALAAAEGDLGLRVKVEASQRSASAASFRVDGFGAGAKLHSVDAMYRLLSQHAASSQSSG